MLITFSDEKLRSPQLSFEYLEELRGSVKQRILEDEQTMAEIKELVEEENSDGISEKLTMQDYIDLKIDEIVDEAVDKIRIYCTFDLEVEIK